MDEAEDTKQLSLVIERVAMRRARDKANIARWGLNIAIFLFAILITIIILISQGIGIDVVAPLAIFGLATVWLMGWTRGNQLYQRFYAEELSSLQQKPGKEALAFLAQLTSKEIEILNYMAQGYPNKQIAFEIGISESTVKSHVTAILSKLNANDRTEAVVIAIKHGLIPVR
ncbi:MAG: response regulator transcription factor [Dehalococcoidales bacterium]